MNGDTRENIKTFAGGGLSGGAVVGLLIWALTSMGETQDRASVMQMQVVQESVSEVKQHIREVRAEAEKTVDNLRSEVYRLDSENDEQVTKQLDKIIARIDDIQKTVNKLQENLAVLLDKGRK